MSFSRLSSSRITFLRSSGVQVLLDWLNAWRAFELRISCINSSIEVLSLRRGFGCVSLADLRGGLDLMKSSITSLASFLTLADIFTCFILYLLALMSPINISSESWRIPRESGCIPPFSVLLRFSAARSAVMNLGSSATLPMRSSARLVTDKECSYVNGHQKC